MGARRSVVGLVLAAALVLVGCGAQPIAEPGAAGAGGVDERLRFNARTVDGADFDGASLVGTPAVLWFWAPWCSKCRAEAPGVAEVARDTAGTVTFVGVAAQDEVPAMQRFVREYEVDFTHLADTEAAVWRAFGVTTQPAYAFVHAAGSVEVYKGRLDKDELAERVAGLG